MKQTRIAIVGGSGYTSAELIKLLLRHPGATIAAITSRDEGQRKISELHPSLVGRCELPVEPFDPDKMADRVDVAFLGLPHGAAMSAAAPLLERGVRVVDLSADYRLTDPAVYAEWYGAKHADVTNLAQAVYGLPELYRDQIPGARLIANPGCYPTTAILGLAPLAEGKLIEPTGIIVDSKSGVSGAGRSPKLMTHFPECNESVEAYSVGKHRHMPEIEQILSDAAGGPVSVIFTPHLIPMDRGIFSTIYAQPTRPPDQSALLKFYRDYYVDEPFVRVIDALPRTKDVVDSNFVDITLRVVKGRIMILVCADNLIKGASGAAVQNFNLMFGYPETTGLM